MKIRSAERQWIASFLVVVFLVTTAFAVSHFLFTRDRYKNETLQSGSELLRQVDYNLTYGFFSSLDVLSFPYRVVESIGEELQFFRKLEPPVTKGIGTTGIRTVLALQNSMMYNPYIQSIQIYFPRSEILIANAGVRYFTIPIRSEEDKLTWIPVEDLDPGAPRKWLYRNSRFVDRTDDGEAITLLCTLPLVGTGDPAYGYIMVNFDKDKLFRGFLQYSSISEGLLLVFDSALRPVLSYRDARASAGSVPADIEQAVTNAVQHTATWLGPTAISIDKAAHFLIPHVSSAGGFRYLLVRPDTRYREAMLRYFVRSALIWLTVMVAAAIMSILLARGLYRPIRALAARSADYLPAASGELVSDEYAVIHRCFSVLNDRLFQAGEYIRRSSFLVERGVFHTLINSPDRGPRIHTALEAAGVTPKSGVFVLLRISLGSGGDRASMQRIEQIVSAHAASFCVIRRRRQLVFVLSLPASDDYLNRYIEPIRADTCESLSEHVACIVSDPYWDIYDTHSQLDALEECAGYSYIYDTNVIISPPLIREMRSSGADDMLVLYASVDQLVEHVKACSEADAYREIDDLVDSLEHGFADVGRARSFGSYIDSTLDRLSRELGIDAPGAVIAQGGEYAGIEDFRRVLKESCRLIMEGLAARRNENRTLLMGEVRNYMRANIDTVTLEVLSDHFAINKTYLSELFVLELGTHYSKLLRDMKIDEAKILLRRRELRARDVAQRVGYTSARHFAAVFKSVTGFTPSQYARCVAQQTPGTSPRNTVY